jgi:hypothetical protein
MTQYVFVNARRIRGFVTNRNYQARAATEMSDHSNHKKENFYVPKFESYNITSFSLRLPQY